MGGVDDQGRGAGGRKRRSGDCVAAGHESAGASYIAAFTDAGGAGAQRFAGGAQFLNLAVIVPVACVTLMVLQILGLANVKNMGEKFLCGFGMIGALGVVALCSLITMLRMSVERAIVLPRAKRSRCVRR